MSEDNLFDGLEGLNEEQKQELLRTIKNQISNTKSRYIETARVQGLQQRYEAEVNKLPDNMSQHQRLTTLTNIKAKYRALGLDVF